MSIEQALADNTAALKHLATVIASAGAAGALAAGGDAGNATGSEGKKGPGRPAGSGKKEEPTGKSAETPAGSTQGAGNASAKDSKQTQTATAGKVWNDVVEKVKELLKSKEDGHGKPGVEKVIAHFGLAGQKVPALEALGKHDEVFAAIEKVLKNEPLDGAEESDDDILG